MAQELHTNTFLTYGNNFRNVQISDGIRSKISINNTPNAVLLIQLLSHTCFLRIRLVDQPRRGVVY